MSIHGKRQIYLAYPCRQSSLSLIYACRRSLYFVKAEQELRLIDISESVNLLSILYCVGWVIHANTLQLKQFFSYVGFIHTNNL